VRVDELRASNQHDVPTLRLKQRVELASSLAQETLRSIAFYRIPHVAACRDANTAGAEIIGANDQDQ
jgi:hypothetical protein